MGEDDFKAVPPTAKGLSDTIYGAMHYAKVARRKAAHLEGMEEAERLIVEALVTLREARDMVNERRSAKKGAG